MEQNKDTTWGLNLTIYTLYGGIAVAVLRTISKILIYLSNKSYYDVIFRNENVISTEDSLVIPFLFFFALAFGWIKRLYERMEELEIKN